jgi:hypothetical protein
MPKLSNKDLENFDSMSMICLFTCCTKAHG